MAALNRPIKTWPKEEAARAKLYIPKDYDPYQRDDEEPGLCVLDYDAKRHVLTLISSGTGETLDLIKPDDVIGAGIEVELFDSANELRANNKNFRNKRLSTPSSPADSGIFGPLADNADRLFSISSKEPVSEITFDTQAAAILTIYVYPRLDQSQDLLGMCGLRGRSTPQDLEYMERTDASRLGSRCARHRRFQIAPAEDFSDVSALVRAIRNLSGKPKAKRLLVIVNPFSGSKLGKKVYEEHLAPMLEQGGFEHDYFITERARHAEDRMKCQPTDSGIQDIECYDGLVAVGGDGILHEIFQGIQDRSDSDRILGKVAFGHVGAGTSNGFSKSLTHACRERSTAIDYCFQVAKGNVVKLDISKYQTTKTEILSFLTYSWGLIADVDIESEAIRFLGSLRMDLWAVWRVLCLRTYRARFSFVPEGKHVELPALGEPLSEDWVTEEDEFILFWASHVTHAAERTFHSPPSELTDGVFTILIVRHGVSRLRLAFILLALDSGSHIDMDGVEFIKCTAYRLEPLSPGSFNDIDGEVVESGPIQGRVLPGAIQVFCNI